MDEKQILSRIDEFVDEEHRLRDRHQRGELTDQTERDRLEYLERALDQCWDLLRQRRARIHAGQNPDDVGIRSTGEVEGYLQ